MKVSFFPVCPVCKAQSHTAVVSFAELDFVRCTDCGLIYKSQAVPTLGPGYGEDYFRFNRAKYLSRWAHRVRKCRRQILDCLQVTPQAQVLCDVGCSAGYVLEAGLQLGLETVGVDISKFAVELCRERGYRAEVGSLDALPLPDASVDVVTLKHTLEHATEPLRALREVHRVLRPGGTALIVVPDGAHWKVTLLPRRGRAFRPELRGWQHHVYFFEPSLARACLVAGLTPWRFGKAVPRPGARGPLEWARFGWMWLYTWLGRASRLRQEMQLLVRKN